MAKINTLEELQSFISKKYIVKANTFERLAEDGEKLPPLIKIWGNYIIDGALVHFPSRRGSGKSLLSLQLCIAISQNYKKFLGEVIEKPGICIYLDYEMGIEVIQRRAAQLKKNAPNYNPVLGDKLIIYNSRKSFVEDFEIINSLIAENKPILVVVDNLRNALRNVNTNSAPDMANFFSILNGLKEMYKFSIIIVDHFKKNTDGLKSNSDLQSGSGVKSDLSDSDILLRNSCQDKNWRLLKRVKSRLIEESDTTKLISLNPDTLWFELVQDDVLESEHIGVSEIEDKEQLKDMANQLKAEGKSLEEIGKILNKGKTTIFRWTQ